MRRNNGITVKAPISAFGNRSAASSLLAGTLRNDAHISTFIIIGCSELVSEVAALVRVNGIQFVHFVFGEADGAELGDAQAETEDDEEREGANDRPIESANQTEPIDSPAARGV